MALVIISLLGNRLTVKFPGISIPVQFKEWSLSVQSGEMHPEHPAPTSLEILPDEIPQSTNEFCRNPSHSPTQFRAIATQLAEITAVEITPPSTGELYPIPKTYPEGYRQPHQITTAYTPSSRSSDTPVDGERFKSCNSHGFRENPLLTPAILESCLNNPETSALYIFPLKALVLDQMKLQQMVQHSIWTTTEQVGLDW